MPQKTVNHLNFYENLKEARMRLNNTVVLYDGRPCYVLGMANHMSDGIIRCYIDEIGLPDSIGFLPHDKMPPYLTTSNVETGEEFGQAMDKWLDKNPKSPVMRKQINSPKFNRFRPFPLGNMNTPIGAVYVERNPTRKTEQGLTSYGISAEIIDFYSTKPRSLISGGKKFHFDQGHLLGQDFRKCILGEYPTFQDVWDYLSTGTARGQTSQAFHRYFSLSHGPGDSILLVYKTDAIGTVYREGNYYTKLYLGRRYHTLKELCENLGVFSSISLD